MPNLPKYRELVGAICEDLAGAKLPRNISAAYVCKHYQVSRETALRALRILKQCGLLEMGRGRPSLVNHPNSRREKQKETRPRAAESLARTMETQIFNGIYPQDSVLPKTTFFCLEHKVSPHTVSKAMQILARAGIIRKSGLHWVVGPPVVSRRSPHFSPIIVVIQQTPDSFSDLLSDPIWFRFANVFIEEAEKNGVELRHVLFDSRRKDESLAAGMQQLSKMKKQFGNRYSGTLIVSPRERAKTVKTIEWIKLVSSLGNSPVYHLCTSLDWAEIEKQTCDLPNVFLGLFGDWKDDDIEFSMTGLVVATLEKLAHKNALFIDTETGPKDRAWVDSRLMNLRKWAEINGTLTIADDLVPPGRQKSRSHKVKTFINQLERHNPTVLIAPNDQRARKYYHICRTLGIQIPGDLSLVSFDNAPFIRPHSISSMDFGMHSLGYKVFHGILGDIRIPKPQNRVWAQPRLNHYGSLSAPRQGKLAGKPGVKR